MDTGVSHTLATQMAQRSTGPKRRRGSDVLLVFWHPGGLHLATVRRNSVAQAWSAETPVDSLSGLDKALTEGLEALQFNGAETALVLEHPEFQHQIETTPVLPAHALEEFLRLRIERKAGSGALPLWVAEPMAAPRTEGAQLLHLLTASFYRELNGVFLQHQLDLLRILPVGLGVNELLADLERSERPTLTLGRMEKTALMQAVDASGRLLVSRQLRADWDHGAEHLAVEANRCALYVKQRFGVSIGRVIILGDSPEPTTAEITKRLPADTHVHVHPVGMPEWLQAFAQIPAHHPTNLLATYLQEKRSLRLWRRALISTGWLAVAVAALSLAGLRQRQGDESRHFSELQRDEPRLLAERQRLESRNRDMDDLAARLRDQAAQNQPSVPPRVLAVVANTLPSNLVLHELQTRRDPETGRWLLKVTGEISGDDYTAQESLRSWAASLSRSPIQYRGADNQRLLSPAMAGENPTLFRFALEGALLEP